MRSRIDDLDDFKSQVLAGEWKVPMFLIAGAFRFVLFSRCEVEKMAGKEEVDFDATAKERFPEGEVASSARLDEEGNVFITLWLDLKTALEKGFKLHPRNLTKPV